jgi:hypothetical protein
MDSLVLMVFILIIVYNIFVCILENYKIENSKHFKIEMNDKIIISTANEWLIIRDDPRLLAFGLELLSTFG